MANETVVRPIFDDRMSERSHATDVFERHILHGAQGACVGRGRHSRPRDD